MKDICVAEIEMLGLMRLIYTYLWRALLFDITTDAGVGALGYGTVVAYGSECAFWIC